MGKVSSNYNLALKNSQLAKEWHPTKNAALIPKDVTPNSGKKVWWLCKKGHEWQATVASRNAGHGCSFCSGRFATKDNNLLSANQMLAKEWHPTKNGTFTPKDVTPNSGKKVWWICKKGHEWQATISNRNLGRGCALCSGRVVTEENNLAVINPTLASQWHPTKNGTLRPKDVVSGSGKKVWWLCSKGHKWQSAINNRSNGSGCPYCRGMFVTEENNLAVINPPLASQWHPTKNGSITPNDIMPNSGKKVWWICKKGHEWQAQVSNRNIGNGCIICSGRVATEERNFALVNPILAKEWHPNKNGGTSPNDVTPNSNRKFWWICKRNHEWQATVVNRNRLNRGCPYCHSQSSSIELRIYTEMKHFFNKIQHRIKLSGVECDFYIPEINFAIEFDGVYWHKSKHAADEQKTKLMKESGVYLLRIREEGLTKISEDDIILARRYKDFDVLKKILTVILEKTSTDKIIKNRIKAYLENGKLVSDSEYISLLYMLPSPFLKDSLFNCNSILSKEWHPTKNGTLTPKDVMPNSNEKVWWLGKCGHEWQTIVANRNRGSGCPFCSGKFVTEENNLAIVNPTLANQWHPTKNGTLTPKDVMPNSNKKIWWICESNHEWQAQVNNRSQGNGCAYCSGRFATKENNLVIVNPSLASQWHPTKNGTLTPKDVTPNSNKRAWWFCKRNHEWQATIASRNAGSDCPFCSGRFANNDNNLAVINPTLASQWHPSKNGTLTPKDVVLGSHKKIWWLCKMGHEWQATVNDRSHGNGCPYCSGRFATKENNLFVLNPAFAKEWHPSKNGILTPMTVSPGSARKVWWLCSKGHEWQAVVRDRNRGCPYCRG